MSKQQTKKRTKAKPEPEVLHLDRAIKSLARGRDVPLHVLAVPWGSDAAGAAKYFGARLEKGLKSWVYEGASVPSTLTDFRAPSLSWEAWLSDEINRTTTVIQPRGAIEPREHQLKGINILQRRWKKGLLGTFCADEVGLGKTYQVVLAALGLPGAKSRRNLKTILILCPAPMVAMWRLAWQQCGTVGEDGVPKRVLIMSMDSARSRLFKEPEKTVRSKSASAKNKHRVENGDLLFDFDLIVVDESHRLKDPASLRSKAVSRLSEDTHRWYLTATPGTNPVDLLYASDILAQSRDTAVPDGPEELASWWQDHGVSVRRTKFGGYEWDAKTPTQQRREIKRVRKLLFSSRNSIGFRRSRQEIGWEEPLRELLPVWLDPDERVRYRTDYETFVTEIDKIETQKARGQTTKTETRTTVSAASSTPEGRAALLRFIQKASLIRAPHIVQWVEAKVEAGHQVAVSVEFLETLRVITEGLESRGVSVAQIFGGQSSDEKEEARLAFQRDEVQVVVFTISEGISLHAGDTTVNGSDTPRILCIADPRWSALKSHQIEGRTSRDGMTAETFYSYAVETREEVVISRLFQRVSNQRALVGDEEEAFFSELTIDFMTEGA